jgi:hypothetical protein
MKRAVVLLVVALALAVTSDLWAQCAMCRSALEQADGATAAGFNRAILFLLGTPYLVFASIAGIWYFRKRRIEAAHGA